MSESDSFSFMFVYTLKPAASCMKNTEKIALFYFSQKKQQGVFINIKVANDEEEVLRND